MLRNDGPRLSCYAGSRFSHASEKINLRWIYRIRAPPVTIPTFQICTRAGLPQGLAFNSLTCKDGVNMI